MQAEFSGVGLDPAALAAYLPPVRNPAAVRASIGPVSLRGNAKGSHESSCIRASVEAPRCACRAHHRVFALVQPVRCAFRSSNGLSLSCGLS